MKRVNNFLNRKCKYLYEYSYYLTIVYFAKTKKETFKATLKSMFFKHYKLCILISNDITA